MALPWLSAILTCDHCGANGSDVTTMPARRGLAANYSFKGE